MTRFNILWCSISMCPNYRHTYERRQHSPSRRPNNLPSRHSNFPPSRHFSKPPLPYPQNPHNPIPRHRSPSPRRVLHRNESKLRFTRGKSISSGYDYRVQSDQAAPHGYVGRGRPLKKNAYFSSIEKDCTTYFFTNFPEEFGSKNLWSFFGKIGAVGDIALPPKRDIRGRRFGFVRFKSSEDSARLDTKVKNLFIGNRKLIINKPKFSRGKFPVAGNLPRGNNSVVIHSVNGGAGEAGTSSKGNLSHGTWSDAVRFGTNRNDVNIPTKKILGPHEEIRKERLRPALVSLDVQPVQVDFSLSIPDNLVSNCDAYVIAELEFGLGDFDACACLSRNGVLSIQVIPMDCSKVILKGINFDEIDDIFNPEESWWRTVFAGFRRWDCFTSASDRKAWIRCAGIPAHVWSTPFFTKLANSFGSFVKVSKDTASMRRLDYGFMLVVVKNLRPINLCCNIMVKGVNHEIGLAEMVGWSFEEPSGLSLNSRPPYSDFNSEIESSQDCILSSSDDDDEIVQESFLGHFSGQSFGNSARKEIDDMNQVQSVFKKVDSKEISSSDDDSVYVSDTPCRAENLKNVPIISLGRRSNSLDCLRSNDGGQALHGIPSKEFLVEYFSQSKGLSDVLDRSVSRRSSALGRPNENMLTREKSCSQEALKGLANFEVEAQVGRLLAGQQPISCSAYVQGQVRPCGSKGAAVSGPQNIISEEFGGAGGVLAGGVNKAVGPVLEAVCGDLLVKSLILSQPDCVPILEEVVVQNLDVNLRQIVEDNLGHSQVATEQILDGLLVSNQVDRTAKYDVLETGRGEAVTTQIMERLCAVSPARNGSKSLIGSFGAIGDSLNCVVNQVEEVDSSTRLNASQSLIGKAPNVTLKVKQVEDKEKLNGQKPRRSNRSRSSPSRLIQNYILDDYYSGSTSSFLKNAKKKSVKGRPKKKTQVGGPSLCREERNVVISTASTTLGNLNASNANNSFIMDEERTAKKIWDLGKQLGVSSLCNDDSVVIRKIVEVETRDRTGFNDVHREQDGFQ